MVENMSKFKNGAAKSLVLGMLAGSLFYMGASQAETGERDLGKYPCHSYSDPCGQLPPPPIESVSWAGNLGDIEKGKELAFTTAKGNCLACHKINGGDQGGTVGPSLVDYGKRELPMDYTYQRIWDTRVYNPDAHMPIFGTNEILTKDEIRHIMAFLYSLR